MGVVLFFVLYFFFLPLRLFASPTFPNPTFPNSEFQNPSFSKISVKKNAKSSSQVKKQFSILNVDTRGFIGAFEAQRHVQPIKGAQACDVSLMTNVVFGYDPDAFSGIYKPPLECKKTWGRISLDYSCYGIGSQVSRFVDVFFDNLNVLRAVAPQPLGTGVSFEFDEDITKYAVWLNKTRKVTVMMANTVAEDSGVFACNASLTFWSGKTPSRFADVIIPIAQAQLINQTDYRYALGNKTGMAQQRVSDFPKNIYRAQLEVLPSPSANDEGYWFTTNPYREVVAYIDSTPVGIVTPFPVYYTGALNPYLWSPIVGIGCFGMPSYYMDLTPFVGMLVDGKSHKISFRVHGINTGGVWYITGALHLWLDSNSKATYGKVISNKITPMGSAPPLPDFSSSVNGLNRTTNYVTKLSRTNWATGFVVTSFGNLTVNVTNYRTFYAYLYVLDSYKDPSFETLVAETGSVNQTINAVTEVRISNQGQNVYSEDWSSSFPLLINYSFSPYEDSNAYKLNVSISQAFNLNISRRKSSGKEAESLGNSQKVAGIVDYGRMDARGGSSQNYNFKSNFDEGCYSANYVQSDYIFSGRRIIEAC